MNKKTTYIIVAVLVIVIVVAGAAAYLLMNNGGGGGTTPTPTPAPTVVGASTLQINANVTDSTGTLTYMFSAKNMNSDTSHLIVRMDIINSAGNYTYVVDTGQEKAWLSLDNGATYTQETDYAGDNTMVVTAFNDYVTNLEGHWNGSDLTYSYTSGASTILIYDICPNPTLADSLFATS